MCVCILAHILETMSWELKKSYRYLQTSNYTRNKKNYRIFLKPFGYKVMIICITHDAVSKIWEDIIINNYIWFCSVAIAIASEALYQTKHNWGSGHYNIKHWLLLLAAIIITFCLISNFVIIYSFSLFLSPVLTLTNDVLMH